MLVKMKGLLKGLRCISNIFGEKEKVEIEIGFPTNVKHVAHIGWDGPAATTPSWMNNFKQAKGDDESGTLEANANNIEGIDQKASTAPTFTTRERDLPSLPKPRREPSGDSIGSTEESVGSSSQQVIKTKDKESKQPGTRRCKGNNNPSKQKNPSSPHASNEECSSQNLPNRPKKTRRKKMKKDGSVRSSTRSSKEPISDESGNLGSKRGSRRGSVRRSPEEGSIKSYGVSLGCEM